MLNKVASLFVINRLIVNCIYFIEECDSKYWTFLYNGIGGSNYEPGYDYVIEIRKDTVYTPSADVSTLKYVFIKEVSKTLKGSGNMPSIPI